MRFILHEVKLWFKNEESPPKSYQLLPDKVNVITGDATTGKTSFWSIIDYCLMSGKTNVVKAINEKVSWYGIRFTINGKEVSIARKATQNDTVSSAVYFNYGTLPADPQENIQIAEIKSILDIEFGITDELRFPYEKGSKKTSFNLSYRHFLLFNSLTEDIIGTSKTYFDTTFYGKDEYDRALSYIFDMVIGVNDIKNIKTKERIAQIDGEIKQIQAHEKRKENNDNKLDRNIFALTEKLKNNSLIDYSLAIESIEDAKSIINKVITNTQKAANNSQLFAKIEDLNKRKTDIKTQLLAIDKYRKEYDAYKRGLTKTADSLKPIEFLNKNLSDQLVESYETKKFIDSLEKSLKTIKDSLSKKVVEPLRVTGDEKELRKALSKIENEITELNKIKNNYFTAGQKFILIGEIKSEYSQILEEKKIKPIDTVRLNQLNEEKSNLENNLKNIDLVKFTMRNSLDQCIQRNYNQLNSLPAYKHSKTQFNDSEMVLQLFPEGELLPLENIGSKSNHMFMHLCFYLGLHEHMINIRQPYVPQFLFIDQPSIPYYTGKGEDNNDDEVKLLDAFSLLNSFISYITTEKKESFQIFMVEHASKEFWIENDLTNFHTVDEFIDGKGLIPSDIYND